MRFNLHHLILAPAIMAAAVLASPVAQAETVKVPFSFKAGDKVWPAGDYYVTREITKNLVSVTTTDGKVAMSCIVGPGAPEPDAKNVTLRFESLDGAHVLESVQYKSQISSDLAKKATREAMYSPSRLSQGR